MDEGMRELLEGLQGDPESSGTFSLDPQRMAQVLRRYLLSEPRELVLRAVAAAVACGATWFSHESGGVLRLSWNGQAYSRVELERLWSSLLTAGAPSRLQELAIALNTARTLGEVRLRCPAGQLSLVGSEPVFDPAAPAEATTLELRLQKGWRGWWRRLTSSRSTRRLLSLKAGLAPLEFRPSLGQAQAVRTAWAIRCGAPPAGPVQAERWYDVETSPEWGNGYVCSDPSPSRMQHLGVSVTLPSFPDFLHVCWWTTTLPLDLSRRELQRGSQLKAWGRWLIDLVIEVLLGSGTEEQGELDCLVGLGLLRRSEAFLGAPLFRRADGSRASCREIQQQHEKEGFVATQRLPEAGPWHPEKVLLCQRPHEERLSRSLYSICLDGWDPSGGRLPDEEGYLVRVPLPSVSGEGALRNAIIPELRWWRQDHWEIETRHPLAADFGVAPERAQTLPLYLSLLNQYHDDSSQLVAALHWVSFFFCAASEPKKDCGDPLLSRLFDSGRWSLLKADEPLRNQLRLREMAKACVFPALFGPSPTLLELYHKGGRWRFVDGPWACYAEDRSSPLLMLPTCLRSNLAALLRDRCEFVPAGSGSPLSPALERALGGPRARTAASVLVRALQDSASSASQIVSDILGDAGFQSLLPALPGLVETQAEAEVRSSEEVWRRACLVAGWGRLLCTESILLGLLQARTPLARHLEVRGATRQAVAERIPRWSNREKLAYIDQRLEELEGDEKNHFLLKKVVALLGAQRHQEAWLLSQDIRARLPDHPDTLRALGYVAGMGGDGTAARDLFRSALDREPSAARWLDYGEALRFLGDRAGALRASQELDDPAWRGSLRALQASVTDEPDPALKLCAEARQWLDCPMSVLATEGLAYHRKGMALQAERGLARFVALRPDQCLELDLRERQALARTLL